MMTHEVRCGHVLDLLTEIPDASVDACVTDPPYELGFMGKAWDSSGVAFNVDVWRECLRVLKPGGHLLAFSSARTYHRLACAIEDGGFEIRDQIMWIYGQGFPKSLDVSKAIDKAEGVEREVSGPSKYNSRRPNAKPGGGKQICIEGGAIGARPVISLPSSEGAVIWSGWGTALKPAHEPVCVARAPFLGTVAENVLRHGTGAINIDASRIHSEGSEAKEYTVKRLKPGAELNKTGGNWRPGVGPDFTGTTGDGRWPSNVIIDEAMADLVDQQSGYLESGHTPKIRNADKHRNIYAEWKGEQYLLDREHNSGGASRFFYQAKASQSERGSFNNHATVKPVDLMRYLVRLVTPPNGLVLDLFCGSGTTGVACKGLGFSSILFDIDPASCEIARHRIADVTPAMDFS